MALTQADLVAFAEAINATYGADTIDTTQDIAPQLGAFAKRETKAAQQRLITLGNNFNNALDQTGFIMPTFDITNEGLWDPGTALNLFMLEQQPADIAKLKTAALANITTGTGRGLRNTASDAREKIERFTAELSAFTPEKLALIRSLNDALNGTDTIYAGVRANRDNILSLNAYEFLKGFNGRDAISVKALYEKDNKPQEEAILKAFGGRGEISKKELEIFVRRQIDLRAIKTLAPEIYEAAETAGNLKTVDDQDAFIAANHATLRLVSQAMAQGRFNPDERDVKIAFKAFKHPTLQDEGLRAQINRTLNTTDNTRPNIEYMRHVLKKSEISALTQGRINKLIANHRPEQQDGWAYELNTPFHLLHEPHQKQIFDEIVNGNLWSDPDRSGYAAYERMMLSYYEDLVNRYEGWRNGNIKDMSMDTWNGRYGPPNQDQLLQIYIHNNWNHFSDAEKNVFFNPSWTKFNYDITYDQAVAALDKLDNKKYLNDLKKGVDGLQYDSVYSLLIERRGSQKYEDRSYYHELRNDRFIPGTLALQVKEKFKKEAAAAPPAKAPASEADGPPAPAATKPDGSAKKPAATPETEAAGPPLAEWIQEDKLPPANAPKAALMTANYTATQFNGTTKANPPIPDKDLKTAERAARALEIADNAPIGSEKRIKALESAQRMMKAKGLTEAQVRLHSSVNGTNLIPESKLGKANRALGLLVAADTAPHNSPDVKRAQELAREVMEKAGLTETQVRLLGLQRGTELIPEGKVVHAQRALELLRQAEFPQNNAASQALRTKAQRIMKTYGLSEAQLHTYDIAEKFPDAVKALEKLPVPTASVKAPESKPAQPEKPKRFKVENPNTTPRGVTRKTLGVTEVQMEALEKIHILKQVRASGELNASEKLRLQKMITQIKADHNITDGMIKKFEHRKPVMKELPDIKDLVKAIKGQKSDQISTLTNEYRQKTDLYGPNAHIPEQRIPKLALKLEKIPEIKPLSSLEKAGKLLRNTFNVSTKVSKAGIKATGAGYLIGGAIGSAMAASEVEHLKSKQAFLQATGMLTGEQQQALAGIYKWYIRYAGFDPTTIAGEIDTKQAIQKLGLDPVVLDMVSPDLLIDIVSGSKPTREQYEAIKKTFSSENVIMMGANIAKAHGLTENRLVEVEDKKQEVPILTIMLNSDGRKALYDEYTVYKETSRGRRIDETQNQTERQGLEYLDALNEMRRAAEQMMKEYETPPPTMKPGETLAP